MVPASCLKATGFADTDLRRCLNLHYKRHSVIHTVVLHTYSAHSLTTHSHIYSLCTIYFITSPTIDYCSGIPTITPIPSPVQELSERDHQLKMYLLAYHHTASGYQEPGLVCLLMWNNMFTCIVLLLQSGWDWIFWCSSSSSDVWFSDKPSRFFLRNEEPPCRTFLNSTQSSLVGAIYCSRSVEWWWDGDQ